MLGLEHADQTDVESALTAYVDRGKYTEYGFDDSRGIDGTATDAYLLLDGATSLVVIARC